MRLILFAQINDLKSSWSSEKVLMSLFYLILIKKSEVRKKTSCTRANKIIHYLADLRIKFICSLLDITRRIRENQIHLPPK